MIIHRVFDLASKNGLVPLRFAEILPESDPVILNQLVNKDRVHDQGVQDIKALQTFRLGGSDWSRTCYAVLRDDQIQCAIYVHKQQNPIHSPADLAGDVEFILTSPAERSDANPTAAIFYSISNIGTIAGTGPVLIQQVHAHLIETKPGMVMSTLSPLRQPASGEGIDQYLHTRAGPPEKFDALDRKVQKALILDFLSGCLEAVQKFHMGNGAIIGDIRPGADTNRSTYRIMVNYIYDPDTARLSLNQNLFNKGNCSADDFIRLVSPELCEETNRVSLRPAQQPVQGARPGLHP